MNVEATVLGELRALRQRLAGVSGVVLATTDGMLLASDAPGVDPDPIAALTATSIGLSQQFALSVGYGPVREATVRTAGGVIATFPAGDRALLAVLADDR
ncbi:MAG TPA: roadblock/LC7 domain-containing protein, partial [Micromonosporaceae bacterium]